MELWAQFDREQKGSPPLNVTFEIAFLQVNEFQQFWNCLHACVHLCICACSAFGGRDQAEGTLTLPESTGTEGPMTRVTGSLWPYLGVGWPVL